MSYLDCSQVRVIEEACGRNYRPPVLSRPVHEAERIKGLVCFHHELADKILVDGVEIPKEATAASDGYF